MTKQQIIDKYGIEEYERRKATRREYIKAHKEEVYDKHKEWVSSNKESIRAYNKSYHKKESRLDRTIRHLREYCSQIELVENYELALQDNFVGWHCHHRFECVASRQELLNLGLYKDLEPDDLIFVTTKEHGEIHRRINKWKNWISKHNSRNHSRT